MLSGPYEWQCNNEWRGYIEHFKNKTIKSSSCSTGTRWKSGNQNETSLCSNQHWFHIRITTERNAHKESRPCDCVRLHSRFRWASPRLLRFMVIFVQVSRRCRFFPFHVIFLRMTPMLALRMEIWSRKDFPSRSPLALGFREVMFLLKAAVSPSLGADLKSN